MCPSHKRAARAKAGQSQGRVCALACAVGPPSLTANLVAKEEEANLTTMRSSPSPPRVQDDGQPHCTASQPQDDERRAYTGRLREGMHVPLITRHAPNKHRQIPTAHPLLKEAPRSRRTTTEEAGMCLVVCMNQHRPSLNQAAHFVHENEAGAEGSAAPGFLEATLCRQGNETRPHLPAQRIAKTASWRKSNHGRRCLCERCALVMRACVYI